MKQGLPRLFIYPKDIQIITGKGERYSRSCYKKIKDHYKKEDHHLITVEELANYYGIIPDNLRNLLP